MAIISSGKQSGAPKGEVIRPAAGRAEPRKGRILEGHAKDSTVREQPRTDIQTEPRPGIFPGRFAMLTALVIFCCLGTLAVLLDISDSLRSQRIRSRLAVAEKSVQGIFDAGLVDDEVAFDSRVSLSTHKRSSPRRAAATERKSPQYLTTQVLRIITDANKRQTQARRLAMAIVSESLKQDYDPLFVAAVIKSESAFNEMAVSNKGAQGLMQIMPGTGRYLAEAHDIKWPTAVRLTDAGYNLHLGIKYLKELEGMFQGNRLLTLIAYNWGPGKLDRAIRSGRGVPAECLRYALKILRDHRLWQDSPTALT